MVHSNRELSGKEHLYLLVYPLVSPPNPDGYFQVQSHTGASIKLRDSKRIMMPMEKRSERQESGWQDEKEQEMVWGKQPEYIIYVYEIVKD